MKFETLAKNIKRARESDKEHSLPYDDFYQKIEAAQTLETFCEEKRCQKK